LQGTYKEKNRSRSRGTSWRERECVFWCERSGGDPYHCRGSTDIETRCSSECVCNSKGSPEIYL